jgi:hypothetical protein
MLKCKICQKQFPREFIVKHHVKPQAAGGTDKDIIFICSGCHDNLHAIVRMLLGGKGGRAITVIDSTYNTEKSKKNIIKYSKLTAKYIRMRQEGIIKGDTVIVEAEIPLTDKEARMFKILVKERKTSKKAFLTKLIKSILYKEYPNLKPRK